MLLSYSVIQASYRHFLKHRYTKEGVVAFTKAYSIACATLGQDPIAMHTWNTTVRKYMATDKGMVAVQELISRCQPTIIDVLDAQIDQFMDMDEEIQQNVTDHPLAWGIEWER